MERLVLLCEHFPEKWEHQLLQLAFLVHCDFVQHFLDEAEGISDRPRVEGDRRKGYLIRYMSFFLFYRYSTQRLYPVNRNFVKGRGNRIVLEIHYRILDEKPRVEEGHRDDYYPKESFDDIAALSDVSEPVHRCFFKVPVTNS